MNLLKELNTSSDYLICPYLGGVRFVKPRPNEAGMKNSVSDIYQSKFSVYFIDTDHRILDANQMLIELVNGESLKEISGKTALEYWDEITSHQFWTNDNTALSSNKMVIAAEEGFRRDDLYIQHLSFKFPCYHENKIIGILGFSLRIDPNSLNNFSYALSQLMSTGLLDSLNASSQSLLTNISTANIYLSKREIDVVKELVRGKTAKQIGEILCISRRTVEMHVSNIKFKHNCSSKSELIDKLFDKMATLL